MMIGNIMFAAAALVKMKKSFATQS